MSEKLTVSSSSGGVGVGIGGGGTTIDDLGQDLMHFVLTRLPAASFAAAACVSHCWNAVCHRVFSVPKLASAISLNPALKDAVEEVVDKVLSEPIRPHFAILGTTHTLGLDLAHKYITERLGSRIPVVSYESRGIMGKDVLTDEFKEIQKKIYHDFQLENLLQDALNYGISLTVGFVPGVKVDALPLLCSEDPVKPLVEKFILDIMEYTNSVSGCTSPVGIIMFGDLEMDMEPVIDKLDYVMHPETVIVGDESCHFLYRTVNGAGNHRQTVSAGVALLFMKDSNKPRGIGDIQFHVAISASMVPIGPTFKVAAVKEIRKESTWLSATNAGLPESINGQNILHDIEEELGYHNEYPILYIAVIKRRRYSKGSEKPGWSASMAFHDVLGGEKTRLFVHGRGIMTGDYFHFYYPDPSAALSSCRKVAKDLEKMKQDFKSSADKKQVFGGFIFTSCGRGESLFAGTNVDSSPFLENFPEVPVGGTFCGGEIRRGSLSLYCKEKKETKSMRCCRHSHSSVYLLMSYTPAQPEN